MTATLTSTTTTEAAPQTHTLRSWSSDAGPLDVHFTVIGRDAVQVRYETHLLHTERMSREAARKEWRRLVCCGFEKHRR
jgi:hypothetical protein